MPDPDRSEPEIIDFSSAADRSAGERPNPVRNRLLVAGAAAAAVVVAAAVAFVVIKPGGTSGGVAAGSASPALTRLIDQVTSVPVGSSAAAGDGGDQVMAKPTGVSGPPLAADGKPEVLYVGTEFCPYCATQSWAMIVALSRFGTFTGLSTIRSADYKPAAVSLTGNQPFPALDTWTFYGSSYTSKYLTFVPVETRSNVLISHQASPQSMDSYTRLQRLTAAQQALFVTYDNLQAVPFLDFGNRYVLTGSSFSPALLDHQTWSQIAAALRNPHGAIGRAILGTANYLTAAICQLTGDQPARVCTPGIKALL